MPAHRRHTADRRHIKAGSTSPWLLRNARLLAVGTALIVLLVIAWPVYQSYFRDDQHTLNATGQQPPAPLATTRVDAGAALTKASALSRTGSPARSGDPAIEQGSDVLARISTPPWESQTHEHATILDPSQQGWETEAFAEAAEAQLKRLGDLLQQAAPLDPSELSAIVIPSFVCGPLRPSDLIEVFRDTATVVRRSPEPAAPLPTDSHRGTSGLAEALQQLAVPLSSPRGKRAKFKTVRVRLDRDTAETTSFLELSASAEQQHVQRNTSWDCVWSLSPGAAPRLQSIQVVDYEEVETRGANETWFSDCTVAVLGQNKSFHRQLCFGLGHWLRRIERAHSIDNYKAFGLAVGDVNSDGLDDLFLCQPAGLSNLLLVQNADGTATDRTVDANLDALDHTSSALLVDLDNDADPDLVLVIPSYVIVMENNGQGLFDVQTSLAVADRDVESLSAIDYDNDGRLDLYLCTDFAAAGARPEEQRAPFIYHDANNGAANILWRNNIDQGEWQFEDVTRQVGLDVRNRRHSLAAAWEDYDNDGDLDLYVANDFGQNCLYRNDGGRFEEVAEQAGVVDWGSGMSVSWADYDHDGLMDLYVGNMFSSAGSRITPYDQFRSGIDSTTRDIYRHFAKGNTLFRNLGDGTFEDVGQQAHVEIGRWAWNSLFADVNNDGWDDLLVANGYITGDDTGDL